MTNTFAILLTMFQLLVYNAEKYNAIFSYTIDEYALVTIVIKLKYLYSVLPFLKGLTIDKVL